jgi:hypothetical protein
VTAHEREVIDTLRAWEQLEPPITAADYWCMVTWGLERLFETLRFAEVDDV